jgi:hypothetical protein
MPKLNYSRLSSDMQKTGYAKKFVTAHAIDPSQADLFHSLCEYNPEKLPKFKLTHLGQFHKYPDWEKDYTKALKIIQSQFMLAKKLLEMKQSTPNLAVISESLNEDLDWEVINKNPKLAAKLLETANLFKAKFPGGLPEKAEDLNIEQQYWLVNLGATNLLFFLDQLPVVYKALPSDKVSHALALKFSHGEIEEENTIREKHALDCLKRAVEIEREKKPGSNEDFHGIIVYGTHHDFSFSADDPYVSEYHKAECHVPLELANEYFSNDQEPKSLPQPVTGFSSAEPSSSSLTIGNAAVALLFGAAAILGAKCCMRRARKDRAPDHKA